MDSIELIVNDEALELSDVKLALTFQAQDLGDISEKLGSYSRSFVIPVTAKNRRLLDNAFTFQSSTTIPYSTIPAILKMNGIEIKQGNILIENDGLSLNAIRLTFYTGNSTFFQRINAIQLSEVCLKEAGHLWNATTIMDNRLLASFFYPLIDYLGTTSGISTINPHVHCKYLLPAMSMQYILDKVAAHLGYTFVGDMFSTPLWQKLFYPFSNSEFIRDTDYARRNTWETEYTSTQIFNQLGGFGNLSEYMGLSIANLVGGRATDIGNNCISVVPVASFTVIGLVVPQQWYNVDNCKIKVEVEFTWIQTNGNEDVIMLLNFAALDYINPSSRTVSNGTGVEYIGGALSPNQFSLSNLSSFPLSTDTYTTVFTFEMEATAHAQNFLSVYSNDNWRIFNTRMKVTFVQDLGNTEADRNIRFNQLDELFTFSIVSPSSIFVPQTIGTFIKGIAQLFGCILIANEDDKTVEFFSFQKLYDNIGYAKDWSNKVVNINSCNWTTRSGKYGQLNYFKYDNEDDVLNDLGQSVMTIADTTLQSKATIIELPYSATNEVTRMTDKTVGQILRFTGVDGTVDGADKQHIVEYEEINTTITYYINGISVGSRTRWSTGLFEELDFSNYLFDAAYRLLTSVTTQYKELTVQLMLNAVDIQQLDFRLPVYLEQFNAHFYITKIGDWQLGVPTKVVLLKLV
jgi:hypothetical protein